LRRQQSSSSARVSSIEFFAQAYLKMAPITAILMSRDGQNTGVD
jgi:hypothetical protein